MKKNLLCLLALILVFALAAAGCGADDAGETAAAVPADPDAPLGLTDWSMSATTWSSPNGATVNLTATPTGYAEGQSAAFCVRLEGDEIENIPCEWDGAAYTAAAELNAADGYCYYVILTAANGTQTEVAVNIPTAPIDETLINLESSLNAYCNLLVEDAKSEGGKLTITAGSAQVQLPRITQATAVTCSEASLVLSFNGGDVARETLTLSAPDAAGICTLDISGASFQIPALEDDQQVDLRLDATLSNGQSLTAPGGSWFYNGGELFLAAG